MANYNGQWNSITYGFKVGAPLSIDDRLVLTKQEMVATKDDRMPEKYFAVCTDDGKLYIYDKKAKWIGVETRDSEGNVIEATGRFRLIDEGLIQNIKDVKFNGKSVVSNKVANIDVPFTINAQNEVCCIFDDEI